MNDKELKPCPFCGGEAVLYHQSSKYTEYDGDYVYCFRGCGCRTKLFECYNGTGKTHADTEKEAIETWNRRATDYKEIRELHEYCLKIGVKSTIEPLFDGFAIRFNSGGDFIQHRGSYGHNCGCVEPAIGCRLDYTAVELKNAKALVKYHKDRLNKGVQK